MYWARSDAKSTLPPSQLLDRGYDEHHNDREHRYDHDHDHDRDRDHWRDRDGGEHWRDRDGREYRS